MGAVSLYLGFFFSGSPNIVRHPPKKKRTPQKGPCLRELLMCLCLPTSKDAGSALARSSLPEFEGEGNDRTDSYDLPLKPRFRV